MQLRTPKLSERLDPGLLSSLLSSALPPLGQGELADIAGGFERLDRHREQLRDLAEEVTAAKVLADRQRVYSARMLRGSAAELTAATAEMGRRTEELGEARGAAEEVSAELARLGERVEELGERSETVSGELRGLRDSEAYRAGSGIELLRVPWRRGTDDYLAALARVQEGPAPGRVTPAPWDQALADTIADRGVAVHEERVTEELLADLRAAAAPTPA